MSIRQISPTVRIEYLDIDLNVQVLRDGEWVTVRTFDSMSDDYAFTNAREYATAVDLHELSDPS